MRLFIAVDLPPDLRPRVAKLCQGIDGARWIRPEQLHITLRFLGDTPEERLADMRQKLRQVAVPGFSLALTGPGVFPPPGGRKPARVLWLGLDPPAPLQTLKRAIDGVLGPDPEASQRGFSPHLTLARLNEWDPWKGSPLRDFGPARPATPTRSLRARPRQTLPRSGSGGQSPPPPTRMTTRPHHDLDEFLAKHADFAVDPFPVSDFHLYRSTLRPEGALHEIVESFPLG
jgi:2'-5' RNA ligase